MTDSALSPASQRKLKPRRRLARRLAGVSVRYKLLGMVLVVVLSLSIAVTLQVRARLAADLSRELETRGAAIGRDLSSDAESLILTQNIFGLYQDLRASLENNPDVRYVFVLDNRGQVLAHSFPRSVPPDLIAVNRVEAQTSWRAQLLDSGEGALTDIAMPILDGRLGTVRLGLSHARVQESVTQASRELALISLAALLVGVGITLVLTRLLTAPILALVDATRAVGRGDLTTQTPVRMDDEIGELTSAFNVMTNDLARFRDELVEQNRMLAALNAAAQAISGSRSLDEVLAAALRAACRSLNAPAGWVLLPSGSDTPSIVAHLALSRSFLEEETRDALSPCHCQHVLEGEADWRTPVLRSDCPRLARAQQRGDLEAAFACHLSVPLVAHDQPLGVLNLAAARADHFGPGDVELAGAIARQMGVAVDAELQRQKLLDEMARRQALRGHLLERVMAAQEEERGRIALELHDEAGQSLTSLLVGLRMLEEQLAGQDQEALAQIGRLKQLTDRVLVELHRLAMDLRPASLDHAGLVAALEQMVAQTGRTYQIETQFAAVGMETVALDRQVESHIYRITQEALTNAGRHSGALHIDVLLEGRPDKVVAVIEDDGCGFDETAVAMDSHLGLAGMRERAEQLGGALIIESAPGAGATLVLEVPL